MIPLGSITYSQCNVNFASPFMQSCASSSVTKFRRSELLCHFKWRFNRPGCRLDRMCNSNTSRHVTHLDSDEARYIRHAFLVQGKTSPNCPPPRKIKGFSSHHLKLLNPSPSFPSTMRLHPAPQHPLPFLYSILLLICLTTTLPALPPSNTTTLEDALPNTPIIADVSPPSRRNSPPSSSLTRPQTHRLVPLRRHNSSLIPHHPITNLVRAVHRLARGRSHRSSIHHRVCMGVAEVGVGVGVRVVVLVR